MTLAASGSCSSVPASEATAPRGLPVPPGHWTGAPGRLTVLDWAGYEGAASYSFDDTQPSQVEHWPALRDTGVRMTFYAWADVAARSPETWKDVVAHGSELGNHTVTHARVTDLAARYPGLDAAEAATQELDACDALIRSWGQPGVWTMAYPYGDTAWRPAVGDRYLVARTVSRGMVPPRGPVAADLTPNFLVSTGDDATVFNRVLDQAADAGSWVIFTFHALLPTTQNWYAGVEVADVVASLDHGKAGGRLWLDSVVNVAAYRQAVGWLAGNPGKPRGRSRVWTWAVPPNYPPGRGLRVTIGGGIVSQRGVAVDPSPSGFYEVDLDAGELTWTPAAPR